MKYFVKIICGYEEKDQFTIPAQEAHKAYYLFNNPDKRGVFENGLAIIGKDIRRITGDYHTTMGYNKTHELNDDDWNEIRGKGVEEKMKEIMEHATDMGKLIEKKPELATKQLGDIIKGKDGIITLSETEKLTEQFRIG